MSAEDFATWHVIPEDDLREHVEDPSCWCMPLQDDEDPAVWIHNALDGREDFETGERKLS